jgi:hypothetical protein
MKVDVAIKNLLYAGTESSSASLFQLAEGQCTENGGEETKNTDRIV